MKHTHTHTYTHKLTAEQIDEWNKRQLEIKFDDETRRVTT